MSNIMETFGQFTCAVGRPTHNSREIVIQRSYDRR